MARAPRQRKARQIQGNEADYQPVPARTEQETVSMNGFEPRPDGGDGPEPRERPLPIREPEEPRHEEREEREEDDGQEEVEVGGRTLRVDRATAELFRAQEARHQDDMMALRRNAIREPEPRRQEEQQGDPFEGIEKDIFVDPKGVVNKIVNTVTDRLNKDLVSRYTNDQKRQQYMARFYADNKDLVGMEDIVDGVLQQNLQELAAMEPSTGRKRLSTLVRGHIDGIVRRYGQTGEDEEEPRRQRRTVVEGADRGERRTAPRQEEQVDQPIGSISSLLRERRRARQRVRATR